MRFELKISCDNAAFDDLEQEVARILREASKEVSCGETAKNIRDINGNTVGTYKFIGRRS